LLQTQINKQALLKQQLIQLYFQMDDVGDTINKKKVIDLYKKQTKNEHHIGFTGHFSAGKSSMINFLLGTNVLPKSPIPTSANIVKILKGKGLVNVYYKDNSIEEYVEPYDIDVIQEFCKDKQNIEKLEIQLSDTLIPENVSLLDTPGIDAADNTDRFITESSLHLIDVMYYVMDYNHVQSENNLHFLQKLRDLSIPIYIIINQIDKHQEDELSFSSFKTMIEDTFDEWGITPEAIYYTSSISLDDSNNEIKLLQESFFNDLKFKNNRYDRSEEAIKQLFTDHQQFLKDDYEQKMPDELDSRELDDDKINEVSRQLNKWETQIERLKKDYNAEINMTLKNAYLMPATLRDLSEKFLESEQDNFKVGFIGAKKKTIEERNNRKKKFLQSLQQTIESTIEWKLREKLNDLLHAYDIQTKQLGEKIQKLTVKYSVDDLLKFISKGATINGQYVLNYTNDISNDIKMKFRQQINGLWKEIELIYRPVVEKEINRFSNEYKELSKQQSIIEQQIEIQNELKNKLVTLNNSFNQPTISNEQIQSFEKMILNRYKIVKMSSSPVNGNQKKTKEINIKSDQKDDANKKYQSKSVLKAINETVKLLETLDGFDHYLESLKIQKEKLTNRDITIALFGAFSAGKSSFSNALFGEKLLPSSPNPTTAVINRITKSNEENKHGTVKISFKNEETMLNDVQRVMSNLGQNNEKSFIKLTQNILKEQSDLEDKYRSFLQAINTGYDFVANYIGQTMVLPIDQFADFVTDETKACFIETVDLYHDNQLTQKGITIVDTPGTDSVNARHTNVAFDYIKEADAIIYVTYYNHAITSADRDFVMQLGRVKESFALDKMFFVVNAADLAQSDEDLELVTHYVNEQLVGLGIRHANIYPISSKMSLLEKTKEKQLNRKMDQFEQEFYTFIEEDLLQLTMQTAIREIERVKGTLEQQLHAATIDGSEQENYINKLKRIKEDSINLVNKESGTVLQQQTLERIERQLHYVIERLSIRFHDLFSEHFNPTTVTETGRAVNKQLKKNSEKLLDHVGYELLQEMRAVSLRLETFLNDLLQQKHEQFQLEISEVSSEILFSTFEPFTWNTPKFKQAFKNFNLNLFTKTLRIFKNKKSFFENNEREIMKEKFYDVLLPFAKIYVQENESLMMEHYKEQLTNSLTKLKNKNIVTIENEVDNQLRIITRPIDINELQMTNESVKQILSDNI